MACRFTADLAFVPYFYGLTIAKCVSQQMRFGDSQSNPSSGHAVEQTELGNFCPIAFRNLQYDSLLSFCVRRTLHLWA